MYSLSHGTTVPRRSPFGGEHAIAGALIGLGFLGLVVVAFQSWIPHDDGTLAQAAERVLNGEVPHRDFHDTYGGVQAFAHAAAFKLLGVDLRTLRVANLVVAIVAALSVFALVRRFQPVILAGAGGAFVLLVGFSPYPAAMPTWWNGALAVAATVFVLRWCESGLMRNLAFAGALTGVSFLVKLPGAYVGIGISLFLLSRAARTTAHRRFVLVAGIAVVSLFGLILSSQPSLAWFAFLMLPVGIAVYLTIRGVGTTSDGNWREFLRPALIFGVSLLGPVIGYLIIIGFAGGAEATLEGWFRLPALRLDDVVEPLVISPLVAAFALMMGAIALLLRRLSVSKPIGVVSFVVPLAAAGLRSWSFLWDLLILLVVASPVVICVYLGWKDRSEAIGQQKVLLALCVATFAFVQFPFSNPIYALYTVPLVVGALASLKVVRSSSGIPQAIAVMVVAVGVWSLVAQGYVYVAFAQAGRVTTTDLALERGGISVWDRDDFYVPMVRHLEKYAGTVIYAGPDAPQVYFLTRALNATPVLFDFLAVDWDYEQLRSMALEERFSAVVVNNDLEARQSDAIPADVIQAIRTVYPKLTTFGWFDVYERETDGS